MHNKRRWLVLFWLSLAVLPAALASVPWLSVTYSNVGTETEKWGQVGKPGRIDVTGTGTMPIQVDVQGLPPGLTFNPATSSSPNVATGSATGTFTTPGDYNLVASATNAEGTTTQTIVFHVQAADAPPVIYGPLLLDEIYYTDPRAGSNYRNFPILATASPTSYSAEPLPSFMMLESDGTLLLDTMHPGIYKVTLGATNAFGTGNADLVVRIHGVALYPTVASKTGGYVAGDVFRLKVYFNTTVHVSGAPYVDLSFGPGVTSGRATYVSGDGTDTLEFDYTIQPKDAGTIYVIGLSAAPGELMDSNGLDVVALLYLREYSTQSWIENTIEIGSARTATATVGSTFHYYTKATGYPTRYSASGLPGGFQISSATGEISGLSESTGTYSASVTAKNSVSTATIPLTITIQPEPTSSAQGTVGQPFSYYLPKLNETMRYAAGASLPFGLTLGEYTGKIAGTPTQAGTYQFKVFEYDYSYDVVRQIVTLTIQDSVTETTGSSPTIVSAATATAPRDRAFSFQVQATNSPTLYEATGLPGGLNIDSNTGVIAGTPTAIGTYVVGLTARNAYGAGLGQLTIDVTAGAATNLASQSVVFGDLPTVVAGNPVTLTATASSGLPVSFTLVSGNATLNGSTLTVNDTNAATVRATQSGNNAYAPASADLTLIANKASQRIDFASPVSAIIVGQPVKLGAIASSGLPITYTIVNGPATIAGDMLTVTGTGPVIVRATQSGTATVAPASTEIALTGELPPSGRLINLSARASVSEGDSSRSFIAGFVISGSAPKRVLLRAIGPTLTRYGVRSFLANPRLRLFDGRGQIVAENDDWAGSDVASMATTLGAFALNDGSRDASLVVTLVPGSYSMHVLPNGGSGVALAEIYDADDRAASTPLINISTRGYVEDGEGVLTAGFVVGGSAPKRVLIRGVGPGLSAYGVPNVLSDPAVKLYHDNAVVAQNDDWQNDGGGTDIAAAAKSVGAFDLAPGSRDAAMVATLSPGAYSAVVSPSTGGPGAGMVEVYELH